MIEPSPTVAPLAANDGWLNPLHQSGYYIEKVTAQDSQIVRSFREIFGSQHVPGRQKNRAAPGMRCEPPCRAGHFLGLLNNNLGTAFRRLKNAFSYARQRVVLHPSVVKTFTLPTTVVMPRPDPETVQRLRNEIACLVAEQVKALEEATYLGLTTEGANALAERRAKILRLQAQLGGVRFRY